MAKVRITFAGSLCDRVQELYYGRVCPEGIELTFLALNPEQIFHRMLHNKEFDASEMSLSTYIGMVAQGNCPFTAIPVFLSRMFRHSGIYLNTKSGIKKPQDLRGKRIGLPEYQMTAALWIRGFLQHDYGVEAPSITWFTGGLHDPGREQMIEIADKNIAIHRVKDKSLNDMLVSGEIDALITARVPRSFEEKNPNVVRLFPNYEQDEKEYYQRTGLFPIMHTVILRKEVHEQFPWAGASLYLAFQEARRICLQFLNEQVFPPIFLPWATGHVESTRKIMGDDFWPYGFERNLKEIEAMCQYSYEQGISHRKVDPRELFIDKIIDLEKRTRI